MSPAQVGRQELMEFPHPGLLDWAAEKNDLRNSISQSYHIKLWDPSDSVVFGAPRLVLVRVCCRSCWALGERGRFRQVLRCNC